MATQYLPGTWRSPPTSHKMGVLWEAKFSAFGKKEPGWVHANGDNTWGQCR